MLGTFLEFVYIAISNNYSVKYHFPPLVYIGESTGHGTPILCYGLSLEKENSLDKKKIFIEAIKEFRNSLVIQYDPQEDAIVEVSLAEKEVHFKKVGIL